MTIDLKKVSEFKKTQKQLEEQIVELMLDYLSVQLDKLGDPMPPPEGKSLEDVCKMASEYLRKFTEEVYSDNPEPGVEKGIIEFPL